MLREVYVLYIASSLYCMSSVLFLGTPTLFSAMGAYLSVLDCRDTNICLEC